MINECNLGHQKKGSESNFDVAGLSVELGIVLNCDISKVQ